MHINTLSGFIYIFPEDDCRAVVNAMLALDYNEEFCIAGDFSPQFISRMMEAGFLVMSANLAEEYEEPDYILLPKLHLERSVLFFENLHIKKSVRRLLNRYELRPDAEFDRIIDRCVEKHGDAWLTPPLVDCIKKIRKSHPCCHEEDEGRLAPYLDFDIFAVPCNHKEGEGRLAPTAGARPASFALYRDGKLAAGEFGVVCGKVYTSYSGFYDEDNAGTAQIILAARYLQEQGFLFLDLGMPLDYKTDFGAVNISPQVFVELFREAGC